MKIAFIGAPALKGSLGNHITYLNPAPELESSLEDYDGLIIQIDLTSSSSGGTTLLGGWIFVIQILRTDALQSKPVIITAWRGDLVQGLRIDTTYGLVESPDLLRSPLLRFIPLSDLFQQRLHLHALFDAPLGHSQRDLLLKKDLEHNLYQPAVIHEYLHRFKEQVRFAAVFDALELTKELRLYLQQFMSYNFPSQEAELEIGEFLDRHLPGSDSKQQFIHQVDRLEALLDEVLAVHEMPPVVLPSQIIYIDDNPDYHASLQEVLQPFQISIGFAVNQQDAEALINEQEHKLCAVLCDFRFYGHDRRVSRMQGYHILEYLEQRYPRLKYAFLSDRPGLTKALPEDKRWNWPEFKKSEILGHTEHMVHNGSPTAGKGAAIISSEVRTGLSALLTFLDLAERERRRRHFRPDRRLEAVLNSWRYKANKLWLEKQETDINLRTGESLHYYMAGERFPAFHKSIYSKKPPAKLDKNDKRWQEYLRGRLLLRRIILGFWQLPAAAFQRSAQAIGFTLQDAEFRWAVIYFFLTKEKSDPEKLKRESLSKAFSKLGFQQSKSYKMVDIKSRKEIILPKEWQWLQANSNELNKWYPST